jgi:hypothetical protein
LALWKPLYITPSNKARTLSQNFAIEQRNRHTGTDMTSSTPIQTFLCRTCKAVLAGFEPVWNSKETRDNIILTSDESMEDTALMNCHLCLLFVSGLSSRDLQIIRAHQGKRQEGSKGAFKGRYLRRSGFRYDGPSGVWWRLLYEHDVDKAWDCGIRAGLTVESERGNENFSIWSADMTPTGALIDRGELPESFETSTGSRQSLDLARQWLSNCLSTHSTCGNSDVTPLPTRLIDTGPLWESVRPRLCYGATLLEGTGYATLSHCWGPVQPKKLLQDDLPKIILGIQLNELPQTFQDTIKVVRHIGIRYIWIDSLCIIQDSNEDWQKESALMGEVYSNCVCNIAASDATDATKGLFRCRNPQLIRPLKVILGNDQRFGSYYIGDDHWWSDEVLSSSISERGWVCQVRKAINQIKLSS